MIVYKYLHPNRTGVLEDGLIRFTQSPALNDPFETTPNVHRLEQSFREYAFRKIQRASYSSFFNYLRDRSKVGPTVKKHLDDFLTTNKRRYAILSLSTTNNNLLMWAHYCDSHRGFVLGFDSTDTFFQTRRVNAFSTLAEVHYSDERPVMPAPEQWDGSREQILEMVGSEDLAKLMFYTKSSDWAYEHELRIIANPEVADHHDRTSDGNHLYLYRFPPACLKEVIFGIRMPRDQREKITKLVKERYEGIKLFQAKLGAERFDLDIVQFE